MSEMNKADSSGKRKFLNATVREFLKEGFGLEETQELSGASLSYVKQIMWADAHPEEYEGYRVKHRAACAKRRLRLKRRQRAADMRQKKAEIRAAKAPTLIAKHDEVDMFSPIIEQVKTDIAALAYAMDNDTPITYGATVTSVAKDMVNSPAHYTKGGIETIHFIKAKLTHEQYIGYLRGNVLKYSSRLGEKGNIAEDAGKLAWYSRELADALKEHA